MFYQGTPLGHLQPFFKSHDHNYRDMKRFPLVRVSWACMKAAREASAIASAPALPVRTLLLTYLIMGMDHTKLWHFPRQPSPAVTAYRRGKAVYGRLAGAPQVRRLREVVADRPQVVVNGNGHIRAASPVLLAPLRS